MPSLVCITPLKLFKRKSRLLETQLVTAVTKGAARGPWKQLGNKTMVVVEAFLEVDMITTHNENIFKATSFSQGHFVLQCKAFQEIGV